MSFAVVVDFTCCLVLLWRTRLLLSLVLTVCCVRCWCCVVVQQSLLVSWLGSLELSW